MKDNNYFGINLENKKAYLERRKGLLDCKQSTVSIQFAEMHEIINVEKFSRRYFNKDCKWFRDKLFNCTVLKKEKYFDEDEINKVASAYRDLASQLIKYAEELDAAKDYEKLK